MTLLLLLAAFSLQATRAEAITPFAHELPSEDRNFYRNAQPNKTQDSTARIAYESTFTRASKMVSDEPATNSELRSNKQWMTYLKEGDRFLKSRQLEQAEHAFKQAWESAKKSHDASLDDKVLCIQKLASSMIMQDMVSDPLPLYKKSLKMLKKAHGKSSDEVARTLVIVGGIYEEEGDYEKAAKRYEEALGIVAKLDGESSLKYADYQHRYGRAYVDLARYDKAEENYLASLANVMHQQSLPEDVFLEDLLDDYVFLLRKTENDGKVLESFLQKELLKDRLLEQRKRAVPVSAWSKEVNVRLAGSTGSRSGNPGLRGLELAPGAGPFTGSVPQSTISGDIILPRNDSEKLPTSNPSATESGVGTDRSYSDVAALEKINVQRVDFYERMIAADIDSLGRDHPSVARDLSGLASIYLSQRKYSEAKPLLQRALTIYEKNYQGQSGPAVDTRKLLELISEEENPMTEVKTISYIGSLPKIPLQAQRIEIALRLNDLAFMAFCQGKIETSLKLYNWALSSMARAAGEQSVLSAANMNDMSRPMHISGQAREAARMRKIARAIIRRDIAANRSKLLP